NTQGCSGAEQSGNQRENINEFAQWAIGVTRAKERLENRRNQGHAAAAVGRISNRGTDEGISCPGRKAPVEARLCHRLVQGFDAIAVDGVWRGSDVMRQRFGRPVEKQPRADARTEHHGYPGKAPEFWLFVVFA